MIEKRRPLNGSRIKTENKFAIKLYRRNIRSRDYNTSHTPHNTHILEEVDR